MKTRCKAGEAYREVVTLYLLYNLQSLHVCAVISLYEVQVIFHFRKTLFKLKANNEIKLLLSFFEKKTFISCVKVRRRVQ